MISPQKFTPMLALIFLCLPLQKLFAQGTAPIDTDGDYRLEINNKDNLLYLSQNASARWDKYVRYEQTADIVFTAADFEEGGDFYNNGKGFSPIGIKDDEFLGSYDGQGYLIENLVIFNQTDYIGFFGYAKDGTLTNIHLKNATITGYNNVGMLAGYTDKVTITNCSASGTSTGNDIIGGLVGSSKNSSKISSCYSDVNITAKLYLGGLVGLSDGLLIENCYARGKILGAETYFGGLIGWCDRGLVKYSYTTCTIEDADKTKAGLRGGMVGRYSAGTFTDCWYNNDSADTYNHYGGNKNAKYNTLPGVTRTITWYLTDSAWFKSNCTWNFDAIWQMDGYTNDGFPYLQQNQPYGEVFTWLGINNNWNDPQNWDKNNLPGMADHVLIPVSDNNPQILTGNNANCKNLNISDGAILTINDGGSLINTGIPNNAGIFRVKKQLETGAWHLICIPFQLQTAQYFLNDYLQTWNYQDGIWEEITDPTENLNRSYGYSVWPGQSKEYTFEGNPLQNETFQTTLHYVENGSNHKGVMILGNPYYASIDWDHLDQTYGAVYYWDGNNYISWNDGTGSGSQYINPLQAFVVIKPNPASYPDYPSSLVLHQNYRSHERGAKSEGNRGFRKDEIILFATGVNNYKDHLHICINDEATKNFEVQSDAWNLTTQNTGISNLWSVCPQGKLSIDSRPYQETISLGFMNNEAGVYSIGIKAMADIPEVWIEDTKTNTFHELTEGACSFVWELTDPESRFILHLNPVGVAEIAERPVFAYVNGDNLYVNHQQDAVVQLLDLSGRLLYQQQLSGEGVHRFAPALPSGVYLVRLMNDNSTLTQKILLH